MLWKPLGMRMPLGQRSALLLVTLVVAACATKSQILPVTPELDPGVLPYLGAGRTLSLSVTDARADTVVGYRDPDDPSTAIVTAEETVANIERALEKALVSMGFELAESGETADVALQVRLEALQRVREASGVLRTVDTRVRFGATSQLAQSTVTGRYENTRGRETLTTPSRESNAERVNDQINLALTKLLSDRRLFMAPSETSPGP